MKNLDGKRKANGDLTSAAIHAIQRSMNSNDLIRPTRYVGSGRYIHVQDDSIYILELLTERGYKYTVGNDAPRGGASGNFIKCSKIAMKYLESL